MILGMKFSKCFHIGKWKVVKDTGVNKYLECKGCGARKIKTGYCYQPVNWNFIDSAVPPIPEPKEYLDIEI